jgi:hypothetical protein
MEELIKVALGQAVKSLEKQVPTTKKIVKQKSLADVSPLKLLDFMKDNEIPMDAWFGGIDNGDDGYSDICLSWEVIVPTTESEKLRYKQRRFQDVAWNYVYKSLTSEGYKRTPFDSGLLAKFKYTTVYDMFIIDEFDRLVTYYSLAFNKVN